MYSIREIQSATGIKPTMLARWCRSGKVVGAKRIGKCWWIPDEGVRRLLEVPHGR